MNEGSDDEWKNTLKPPKPNAEEGDEAIGLANRSIAFVDLGVTETGNLDQPLPGLTDEDVIRLDAALGLVEKHSPLKAHEIINECGCTLQKRKDCCREPPPQNEELQLVDALLNELHIDEDSAREPEMNTSITDEMQQELDHFRQDWCEELAAFAGNQPEKERKKEVSSGDGAAVLTGNPPGSDATALSGKPPKMDQNGKSPKMDQNGNASSFRESTKMPKDKKRSVSQADETLHVVKNVALIQRSIPEILSKISPLVLF